MSALAIMLLAVLCASDFATASPLPDNFEFTEVSHSSKLHPLGYTVHQTSFLSPPMSLKPGQVVFTNPKKTPLKMPEDGSMIVGFVGEVVDSNNQSMPLTFVYDHHWIAVDPSHQNDLCKGFENYVFGIGAESRKTPTHFPGGYGYPMPAGDKWGGNIHILHTQNLSTEFSIDGSVEGAQKRCNECYYAPGKGSKCTPSQNGTFQCCGDKCYDGSCSCPVVDGAKDLPARVYYLRYTINYVAPSEAAQLKDVRIGVWTTPNCAAYYGVQASDEEPESMSETTFTVPHSGEVVHAIGHLHTGAINVSMWLNGEFVCASYPTYGTEKDVPGNELGHLVKMSICLDKDTTGKTMKTVAGDNVTIRAFYYVGSNDTRLGSAPAGTHLNVMAYMYTVFDVGREYTLANEPNRDERIRRQAAAGANCNDVLVSTCGSSIGMGTSCTKCAMAADVSTFAAANCSVAHIEATCQGKIDPESKLASALPQSLPPYMW